VPSQLHSPRPGYVNEGSFKLFWMQATNMSSVLTQGFRCRSVRQGDVLYAARPEGDGRVRLGSGLCDDRSLGAVMGAGGDASRRSTTAAPARRVLAQGPCSKETRLCSECNSHPMIEQGHRGVGARIKLSSANDFVLAKRGRSTPPPDRPVMRKTPSTASLKKTTRHPALDRDTTSAYIYLDE
jgi:hypothetical protein